jgi:peptidoglycan/LPS O-acetylase OafA/YrhL
MPTAVNLNPAPQNCFDLLRLVFAGMVLWAHAHLIGGFGVDLIAASSRGQVNLGAVGVLGFFAISGFLVVASYSRSRSGWSYLRRRILRIFPAFYANLLITALVIAPIICLLATGGLSAYPWLGPDGAFHYIVVNAGLQIRAWKIGLPPNPDALDGSLWSLALEFVCYLAVLVIGLCGALKGQRIYLLLLTVGLCAFYWVRTALGGAPYPLVPTFVALAPMEYVVAFGVGACFWSFHEFLPPDWRIALLLGIVLLLLAKFGGWALGAPILFPLFVLHLAHSFALRLRHDISYGIYIYHFPIAKLLVTMPFLSRSFTLFLTANVLLTLPLAIFSWCCVERRFLHRDPSRHAGAADGIRPA